MTNKEHCHQQVANNKVHFFDFCRFIPKGRKAKLYLTNPLTLHSQSYKTHCKVPNAKLQILDAKTKQSIKIIDSVICSFDSTIASGTNGTVIFGTILHYNDIYYMFIEDVLLFQSHSTKHLNWIQKYQLFIYIVQSFQNTVYTKNSLVINLPITRKDTESLLYEYTNIGYPIYCIEYLTGHKKYFKKFTNQEKLYKELFIIPDIRSDIYHIYDKEFIGYACIPDLKTSFMMNQYFRIIKENTNIDFIEESDDEHDFENINETKYIHENKSLLFKCKFNSAFQQWIPIEKI